VAVHVSNVELCGNWLQPNLSKLSDHDPLGRDSGAGPAAERDSPIEERCTARGGADTTPTYTTREMVRAPSSTESINGIPRSMAGR
jgi:hypothetical protein